VEELAGRLGDGRDRWRQTVVWLCVVSGIGLGRPAAPRPGEGPRRRRPAVGEIRLKMAKKGVASGRWRQNACGEIRVKMGKKMLYQGEFKPAVYIY
jgi:hypothetical protein